MARNVSDCLNTSIDHFTDSQCVVYLGDHASLSFLDFLRHSLKQLVGDTPFTDGQQHNPMLEPELDETPGANVTIEPSEKRALFESYLAVVGRIFSLKHDRYISFRRHVLIVT